jgi:hypothetical protein
MIREILLAAALAGPLAPEPDGTVPMQPHAVTTPSTVECRPWRSGYDATKCPKAEQPK